MENDPREDVKNWARKTKRTYNEVGHAHEITFSCQEKRHLLLDERICARLLEQLDRVRQAQEFDLWAYVVMSNHVHLLVAPRLEQYSVSAFLKAVKAPTSMFASSLIRQEKPRLWNELQVLRPGDRQEFRFWMQGGGFDRNLTEPTQIRNAYEYIHNNPIKAELVSNQEDWYWSSAAALSGRQNVLIPDPLPWL